MYCNNNNNKINDNLFYEVSRKQIAQKEKKMKHKSDQLKNKFY